MRALSVYLVALTCAFSPALAQSPTERAAEIEAAIAQGDTMAAFTMAQDLLLDVSGGLPLGVRNATLTQDPAQGYGVYVPRESNVYTRGTSIHVYAEPYGFEHGLTSDGLFEIALDVDLMIKTPEGGVLAGQEGIGQLVAVSRNRAAEFHANLTYDLNAPIGRYLLTTVLIDRHGGERVEFDTLIEITE